MSVKSGGRGWEEERGGGGVSGEGLSVMMEQRWALSSPRIVSECHGWLEVDVQC
jgi:hypothetical protein